MGTALQCQFFPRTLAFQAFQVNRELCLAVGISQSGGGSWVIRSWALWSEESEFESQVYLLLTFAELLNLSKSVDEDDDIFLCTN